MKKIVFWCFIFTCSLLGQAKARAPIAASRFEHLSGIRNSSDSKYLWDKRYSRNSFVFGKSPASFLYANHHFLAAKSSVLDMGMGEGRNAVFLAQKGHKVTGIDISSVAIKKARLLSKEFGVQIKTVVASLKNYHIPPNTYDAIICFYYVDRALIPKLKSWLRPGGILIYEGNTIEQRKVKGFENENPDYFLKKNELQTLFKEFKTLKYEEINTANEHIASAVLQKPRN